MGVESNSEEKVSERADWDKANKINVLWMDFWILVSQEGSSHKLFWHQKECRLTTFMISVGIYISGASQVALVVKNPPANAEDARDTGSICELERFPPGGGNGNPLQYFCLENPMARGAWQATVHGVAELDTTEWLSIFASQEDIPWLDLCDKLPVLILHSKDSLKSPSSHLSISPGLWEYILELNFSGQCEMLSRRE